VLDIRNLTVGFGVDAPVLAEASMEVGHGQRLLVCGAAGSGKSTLLNVAAGIVPRLVAPQLFSGTVLLQGQPMETFDRDRLFTAVGSLAQNVEEQLWDLQVEDLIAFPMENRGLPRAEIRDRLHALLVDMELTALRGRRVLTLSGGERRMTAIAAALAMPPQLLVLDEPTTGLDPAARVRLLKQIGSVAGEVPALVIAEQDPSAFDGLADSITLLTGGRLSPPASAGALMRTEAPWLETGLLPPRRKRSPRPAVSAGKPLVSVADIRTELTRRDGRPVLQEVSFELRESEVVGLIGRNGAGKTTLFQSVLGLSRIAHGSITIAGESATGWTPARRARSIAYLPQNMRRILFNMTVVEEVIFAITARTGAADADTVARARGVLDRYGLGSLADANPFALSARQQALLGLACADAASVLVAILDEPLLARDLHGRKMLDLFLDTMLGRGKSVMMISHDLELVDDVASRTLILEEGRIAFDGPTGEAWRASAFRSLGWAPPYKAELEAGP